jgi:ZIP family zinc transporter
MTVLPILSQSDQALLAIGAVTGLATLAGGTLALRLKSQAGPLFGFAGGVVLGVVLFELLPEAFSLGSRPPHAWQVLAAAACGFGVYLLAHRALSASPAVRGLQRHLGPGALTAHSLMDGLGIGLAFQVSPVAGAGVALAVLAHDCLDGANTVTLAVAGGSSPWAVRGWLFANALAPLAGIGLSRLIALPKGALELLLGLFAGILFYIGSGELLPRAMARGPRAPAGAAAVLGLAALFLVVRASGV